MCPDTSALELSQHYQRYTGEYHPAEKVQHHEEKLILSFMTYSLIEMHLANGGLGITKPNKDLHHVFPPYDANANTRLSKLKSGEITIDIGAKLPADRNVSMVKLFSTSVSVLVRRDSNLNNQLSLDEWQKNPHAIWSLHTDYYCRNIKNSINAAKLLQQRKISMVSANIINMISFCSTSDSIMMVPDYFIPMITDIFPVKKLLMPEELDIMYDCFLHYNNNIAGNKTFINALQNIVQHF
jgi:DNA-binding transcriptional LysR family regulator